MKIKEKLANDGSAVEANPNEVVEEIERILEVPKDGFRCTT